MTKKDINQIKDVIIGELSPLLEQMREEIKDIGGSVENNVDKVGDSISISIKSISRMVKVLVVGLLIALATMLGVDPAVLLNKVEDTTGVELQEVSPEATEEPQSAIDEDLEVYTDDGYLDAQNPEDKAIEEALME